MAKTSGRGFIDLERQEQQRQDFVQGERGGQGSRGNAREWSQRESSGAGRLDDLAAHHEQASFHHETASFHHGQAAKHFSSGNHGTASQHADAAESHGQHAEEHSQRARQAASELDAERRQSERDRRRGDERRRPSGQVGFSSGEDDRREVQGRFVDEDQKVAGAASTARQASEPVSKVEQSSGQEIDDSALPNGKPRGEKN